MELLYQKMSSKNIRVVISKILYDEIQKAEQCLHDNESDKSTKAFLDGKKYKSELIDFQIASDKIGKYLKSLRDNKMSKGIFKR
jgi:hypothetical protein